MGIFGRISDLIFKPPAAPPKRVESTHQLRKNEEGRFLLEAETLDEYRAHWLIESDVHAFAARILASYVDLKSTDGSAVDLDPRPGHVVSEAANKEYHPDTGKLSPWADTTIHEADGKIEIQSAKPEIEGKVWGYNYNFSYSSDSRTASYTYNRVVPNDRQHSNESKLTQHPPVSFPVDKDGQVTVRRTAQSLEEAAANRGADKPAKRASELLTSAMMWNDVVQKFDGKQNDRNSKHGEVVLPLLLRGELAFALDRDPVMGGIVGS